ncbi:MAG TPA: PASTA domain-containing protein [Mycobacterium sp.]|nr:PASTA domain-containing protein [Mycobacterium sp.]
MASGAWRVDDSTVEPAPQAQPNRPSWLIRLRWPTLIVGLLLTGGALTYLLVPPMVVADKAITVNPDDLIAAQQQNAEPMPSVLGLNRDIAQTVLADAGLSEVTVTIDEKPAAGPVARVVSQTPSAGTASVQEIVLTVSTPAPMPDVVGRPMLDVRSELEQLGAVVEIVPRFDPAVPKNQIVDVSPKPGEPMPTVVSLMVGDPGDALTLASASPVDRSNCGTLASATVNGTAVGDSITCDSGKKTAFIEYALSRHAAGLETVVGTSDSGRTGAAHLVILGDGRELASADVWLGQSVPIRADLTGVLRLRIEVTTEDTRQNPTVILGDARLLGLPDDLDAITTR